MDLFADDYYRKTGKKWKNGFGVKFLFLPVELRFLYHFRKAQLSKRSISYHWIMQFLIQRKLGLEISPTMEVGGGLYIGHPWGITINPDVKMGRNINIHKGVTIGQENRGERKGVPQIKDFVWFGINSTVVGNIEIGTDVLIASNTFVNCDIPDHSVVIGNPCKIIPTKDATSGYINFVKSISD